MPMDEQDIIKYRGLYLQTAQSYLIDMQRNIILLANDPERKDSLEIVHLSAHSLASQSLMMGFNSIAAYSSVVEKIAKAKQEGTLSWTKDLLLLIDSGITRLQAAINEVEKTGMEIDLSPETKQLQETVKIP
jgi:chemotaxis protein histidine kinase CheA